MHASLRLAVRWQVPLLAGCLLLAVTPIVGCSQGGSPGDARATPLLTSADEVLKAMAEAYRNAKTYEDGGQFRLKFDRGDERVDETADFSVTLARPNKLRMHAYQTIVVCDGKQYRATISDLANQVLDRPAPEKLAISDVFADPVLFEVVTNGMAGAPIQLGLLLDKDSLGPILKEGEKPKLLDAKKIDDQMCYGVEIKRPDGKLVFWVDQQSFALRRLEYPTDALRAGLEEQGGPKPTDLSLVAEFKGARLDHEIEQVAFELELPSEAKLVERFNVRPPPHELLGQKVKDFTFATIDGKPIDRASLEGKIVVIDFWATWCEWCFKGLPNLQYVYDQYKDNDKVVFLAVSTDEPRVSEKELQASFEKAELKLPIFRDLDRYCESVFQVKGLPTMVVLGPDGKVQIYETGYQPQLAMELPAKLEKLLAGENLYEQAIKDFEEGGKMAGVEAPVQLAEIAKKTEPAKLKLSSLWTCAELTRPGNFLIVQNGEGQDQVFVLDAWRTAVELSADGKIAARHELDIPKEPEEAVISFLRTMVDGDGKRYFAGSAVNVQQVHLFDDEWKTQLSFPDKQHAGIADVQLADLNGDGQPELNIGYWGEDGVQNVALSGKQHWVSRALDNVMRLAVVEGQGKRELLAASLRGNLVPFNAEGKDAKPIVLAERFIRLVFSADLDGDGQSELCAITQNKLADGGLGPDIAVGLNAAGDELWNHPLPPGVHPEGAIEMVSAGKLLPGETGQWVIAGADGSVHILSAGGEEIDHFGYGVALSGIAIAQLDGHGVLLLSSEKGVEALQVEP